MVWPQSRPSSAAGACVGLILSGGGARAAYQVGVLKAIARLVPRDAPNPFAVICGTSAGAINAAALATHAAHFRQGVRGLEEVWGRFRAEQVYRTDAFGVSARAMKWLSALFLGGVGAHRPVSLLDNRPLRELLGRVLRFERIERAIAAGHLRGLSITASRYTGGESVSFFQGVEAIQEWGRARRLGVRTQLGLQHLLASSAIPVVFPAVRIGGNFYGDGSVRQFAPISPALHMGAERVLVIGVSGRMGVAGNERVPERYPSVAEILGHVLDSAFIDMLQGDLERLERINRTLDYIPAKVRGQGELGLRKVESLHISPSEELDDIAAVHAHELPRSLRFFLRGSGATTGAGSTVASYLLFEQGFTRALLNLGYRDAMQRETELLRFLGYDPTAMYGASAAVPTDLW
ncbi:patatin-like phospholipase family protein [Aquisalimonas sp.]|uniref:patatin-like phospholipase family protein n=1 Tax=Aquisalimonas sp. TaxID=1872621 RepID=UPI0025BA4C76|nr:patatin-like phospholipase family protein [Aquisalimonas sp.]